MDQRQSYKDDFNAEYDEYRILHGRVENITRRFTQLDTQCKKLAPGTKEYQVITQKRKILLEKNTYIIPVYRVGLGSIPIYWI